jgi:hypothetical protein
MLAHLDGSDRVEGRRRIEVAIILQPNFNAVGQSTLGGAGDREIALLRGMRDSGGARTVALCRVKD